MTTRPRWTLSVGHEALSIRWIAREADFVSPGARDSIAWTGATNRYHYFLFMLGGHPHVIRAVYSPLNGIDCVTMKCAPGSITGENYANVFRRTGPRTGGNVSTNSYCFERGFAVPGSELTEWVCLRADSATRPAGPEVV